MDSDYLYSYCKLEFPTSISELKSIGYSSRKTVINLFQSQRRSVNLFNYFHKIYNMPSKSYFHPKYPDGQTSYYLLSQLNMTYAVLILETLCFDTFSLCLRFIFSQKNSMGWRTAFPSLRNFMTYISRAIRSNILTSVLLLFD